MADQKAAERIVLAKPPKPIKEMTPEERREFARQIWRGATQPHAKG